MAVRRPSTSKKKYDEHDGPGSASGSKETLHLNETGRVRERGLSVMTDIYRLVPLKLPPANGKREWNGVNLKKSKSPICPILGKGHRSPV